MCMARIATALFAVSMAVSSTLAASNWELHEFNFPNSAAYLQAEVISNGFLDFDGDGDIDIVAGRFFYPTDYALIPLLMLRNDGLGNFKNGTKQIFPGAVPKAGGPPNRPTVADFNGDNRADVFLGNAGPDFDPFPGALSTLLLSSGEHGFVDASATLPQVMGFTHSAAAGDIDGDGSPEILVMNIGNADPYFLINDGNGGFARDETLLPADTQSGLVWHLDVLLFDCDGDEDNDLFLGSADTTNPSIILLNDGTGDFSGAEAVALPTGPFATIASPLDSNALDLNSDGALDLVLTLHENYERGDLQTLVNNGSCNFADESGARLPDLHLDTHYSSGTQVPDINGDGFVDLMQETQWEGAATYLINDGTGHFVALPQDFLQPIVPGSRHYDLDANGDGRQDVIVYYNGSGDGESNYALYTQNDPGRTIVGTGNADTLFGDNSSETLTGRGGKDVIFAGRGNDTLNGDSGADYMNGGRGRDVLKGGTGPDILVGGLGTDSLFGGRDADRFVFNDVSETPPGVASDAVEDFRRTEGDKLVLAPMDADVTQPGDQAFVFIGQQSFSDYRASHPGVLGMVGRTGDVVRGNVDADLATDFEIRVVGVNITSGDIER